MGLRAPHANRSQCMLLIKLREGKTDQRRTTHKEGHIGLQEAVLNCACNAAYASKDSSAVIWELMQIGLFAQSAQLLYCSQLSTGLQVHGPATQAASTQQHRRGWSGKPQLSNIAEDGLASLSSATSRRMVWQAGTQQCCRGWCDPWPQ
jgi:hypothetical protein